MKKVSVIVPVYNSEEYLNSMLDCLVCQTYPKDLLEIIMVNDGSIDSSEQKCKEYCEKFTNFKLISQKNMGVSSARNTGLLASTGEYVTFLDSDDTFDKRYIELMAKGLEKTNADMVCCGIIEKINNVTNAYGYNQDKLFPITDEQSYVEFFNDYWLPVVWNKLYRKSLIKEYFKADISYDEDTIFNLYYLKNVKNILCINEKLYCYHIRDKGASSLTALAKRSIFEKSKITNKYRINISKQIFKSKKAVFVACRKIIKAIFQEVKNNNDAKMSKQQILSIASQRLKDEDVINSFSYFDVIFDCDVVIKDIIENHDLEKLYDCAINGFEKYCTNVK